jgi:RNA polymerase sigma-70 factor (ECF subfamily)
MMTQQNTQPAFHRPHPDAAALADAGLVTRVRAGDPAGFEMIMRRHNRRLYRLARGILRNGSEAEDVVQEAYVRSYEKLDDFIGPNGFGAWLGKIVVNEALGRLRKRGRVISLDDHVRGFDGSVSHHRIETMIATQPDPERLAASGELRRLIENAIDALPDDFRMVFILRTVEGLNVSETAQYLSIRPETVKTRFHRARRLLQGALGPQLDSLMPSAFAFGGQRCDRIVVAVLGRLGHSFEATRRSKSVSRTLSPTASAVAALSRTTAGMQA